MRIRLWSVFVLAGIVIGATLIPFNRAPARDDTTTITCPVTTTPPIVSRPTVKVTVPAKPATTTALPCRTTSATTAMQKPASKPIPAPTMTVNSRKIRLNVSLSDVGPSGVSSVELWATRDGQSWQRCSTQPPPNGPLVVHVPEEGRYGFTLVVKSGVGVSAPPPRPGDQPQLWVEVDETRPHLRLQHAEAGKNLEADNLTVTWIASDANFVPRPVAISISPNKEGPWTPIASNLENTGRYVWQMPKDVPYQFYVRVEVSDRAGNCTVDCWPEPIRVDRSVPHGTILGIDADKKVEAPPAGPTPVGDKQVFNFIMGLSR
jgi:hypothetical protein